jgi:DNA polymerase (family 10)
VASVDVRTIVSLLREYAQRTALRGGNPYRAKAYTRAADSLAALAVPLDVLIAEDRLTEIPGVGDAIADIITKLHKTGSHPSLEKLRKEIPEGVLELLAVPGLRPEKVLRLYKDLGITSLAETEAAAKDDRIKKAKGLRAALQTKILQNLAIAKSGEGRLHLHRAAALLAHAKDSLRKARPELKRVTIAGDFRRGCELVGDLTIVAEAAKTEKAIRRRTDCKSACPTATTSAPPFFSAPAPPLTSRGSRLWPLRRECGWRLTGRTRAAP